MSKKRLISIVLSLVMVLSLVPQGVFAASGDNPATTGNNSWQIVDGEYAGNGITNKTVTSDDGLVRIQKNVKPTGVENEFEVYMAVDTKTVQTVTHTDVTEYLLNVSYYESWSSNSGGSEGDLGTPKGSLKENGDRGHITIIMRYHGQIVGNGEVDAGVPNSWVYLEVGDQFITLGNFPNKVNNITFDVELTDRAYEALFNVISSESQSSSEVIDMSNGSAIVTDIMGDYITYMNTISADGTVVPSGSQIEWALSAKANPETTEKTTRTVTSGEGTNTVVTETITEWWNLNIAELTYKVRLNVDQSGFTSGSDYNVNTSAVISYVTATDEAGNPTATGSAVFPVPKVTGTLYDFSFTKQDDAGNALGGAVFTLVGPSGNPDIGSKTWPTVTSSEGTGAVAFTGLPWGTYTLTETPPAGYSGSGPWTLNIGYTKWTSGVAHNQSANDVYDFTVANGGSGIVENTKNTITVTKVVETFGEIQKNEIDHTFYIMLWDRNNNTYLKDAEGNYIYQTVTVNAGVPSPETFTFEQIPTGSYSVWELSAAPAADDTNETLGQKELDAPAVIKEMAEGPDIELRSITTSGNADLTSGNNASVTVTNTYAHHSGKRDVTVRKAWARYNGTPITAPEGVSVVYTLYRSANNGALETVGAITLDGTESSPWTAVWTDLPTIDPNGYTYIYKVRETSCSDQDYKPYLSQSAATPMTDNDYQTNVDGGTIWNKKQSTDVTVQKVVSGQVDPNQTFDFSATLSDGATFPAQPEGITVSADGATATFKLKHGDTIDLIDLPIGKTLTITEVPGPNYTAEQETVSVTITDPTDPIVFTNTRKTGSLAVSKTVVSDATADSDVGFEFTIQLSDETISGNYTLTTASGTSLVAFSGGKAAVTLKNGETATISGLPVGVGYTVTEAGKEGFVNTGKTGDEGTIATTLSTASFENTRETGALEITKIVASALAADADQEFEFEITLYGIARDAAYTVKIGEASQEVAFTRDANGNAKGRIKLKGGQTATISGLPTGVTYRIDEIHVDGFELTETSGITGTISKQTSSSSFTNTRQTNDLTITKTVVVPSGFTIDTDKEFTFTIKVNAGDVPLDLTEYGRVTAGENAGEYTFTLKHNGSLTLTDLPYGVSYVVTETPETGYEPDVPNNASGTIEGEDVTVAFGNNYSATGTLDTSTTAVLNKTVTADGTKWAPKTFEFTITPVDGAPLALDADGAEIKTGTATFNQAGTQIIDFGTITYTAPGTYTYNVQETTTSGSGWTCDNTEKTVTVEVVDNGNGTLTATPSAVTITNKYEPTGTLDTSTTAVLNKTVTADGTAWAPKTFEFTITPVDGAPLALDADGAEIKTGTATFNASGTQIIDFGTITYTKAGTYTYKVKETTASGSGWTCDNEEKTVTVEVVDNGNGTLTATVETPAAITNTYSATGTLDTSTTAVLNKTVVADGDKWAPKTFEFTITPVEGAPLALDADGAEIKTGTATFNASGTQIIDFGTITYTKAGTYTYKVKETTASGSGWTCDNEEKTVTVEVVDNGNGTLTATVETPAAITNTYSATGTLDTSTTAVLNKTVVADGDKWAPKTFEFTITPVEGAPLALDADGAEIKTGTATFNQAGTQIIDFGTITYTKAGTYTYTVQETTTSGSGWTCDNEEKTVTVEVVDNGNGTLTATPTAVTITNKYEPTGTLDTSTTAVLNKTVTADGTKWAPKTFEFTITPVDGAPLALDADGAEIKTGTATFNAAGTQIIDFGTITYTKAGTYTYKVKETTTSGSGWTCDNEEKTVTVEVVDNGNGTLTATPTAVTITNTYAAKGEYDASKNFGIKDLVKTTEDGKGHTFSFTVSAEEGIPMPANTTASVEYAAGATGTQDIPFGKITYTKAGTYTYTITETVGDYTADKGWTITGNEATVTVEVVDNGDGTLTATVETPATIKNSYAATGEYDASKNFGIKDLVKTTEDGKGHTFSFTVSAEEGTPMPANTTANVEYAAGATGTKDIPFGKITYTKAGTYTYTITETVGDYTAANGWTITGNEATVTVEVVDNGDGTLTATVETPATIKNSYSATGTLETSTTAVLNKTVKADGTKWAPKTFEFTITPVDGAPLGVDAQGAEIKTGTATFDKAGTQIIDFGKITYTKAGTYTYKVKETTASGSGWTCDNEEKTVTVEVVDNGDGTLTATPTAVTITNTYKASSATAVITVEKLISAPDEWKSWNDLTGRFTFTLTAEEGTPMPEKTSLTNPDKDGGKVTFGDITFTAPGTYTYTVTETGVVLGITNDKTAARTVTIEVVDNGDGTMTATPSVTEDKPLQFTNTMDLTEVKVEKIWDDNNDQDGKRPETITVTLYANGKAVRTAEINEKCDWQFTFTELPETQDGKAVEYTVKETDVNGYTASYDQNSLKITNTHKTESITVTVTKVWKDEDNRFGVRPAAIKVDLYADGTVVDTVELTDDKLTHTFTVPKYAGGKEITYTVDEQPVTAGYEKKIEGDATEGFTITNTFAPCWGDPPVKKELVGDTPAEPGTFTFKLTAESFVKGEGADRDLTGKMPMPEAAKGAQEMTMDVSEVNVAKEFGEFALVVPGVYTYTITEVKGSEAGYSYSDTEHVIVYTVTVNEKNVLECVKTVDGKVIEGEEKSEANISKFSITNEYKTPSVDVKVTKVWDDADDEGGSRPATVTVHLLANGKDTGKTLVLGETTKWEGTFEGVDKYDAKGKEITYTVKEDVPKGYLADVTGDMTKGFVITNTVDVPDTGDHNDMFMWSGAMITSMLAVVFLATKRRKEEQYR